MKALVSSFHLYGHTLGFLQQAQKVRTSLKTLEITAHKQYHMKALLSSFHLMFKGFVKAFDGGLHETTFCP